MGALKTVFRRIGGRIIPIRVSSKIGIQSEAVTMREIKKTRALAKEGVLDELGGFYLKSARLRSKAVGERISKRISRFKKKGWME